MFCRSLFVFSGVRVARSLVLCVCFVDRCLSCCTFSFGHCVICPSSIYRFWLITPLVSSKPSFASVVLGYAIMSKSHTLQWVWNSPIFYSRWVLFASVNKLYIWVTLSFCICIFIAVKNPEYVKYLDLGHACSSTTIYVMLHWCCFI
jgi:hypothetical protein